LKNGANKRGRSVGQWVVIYAAVLIHIFFFVANRFIFKKWWEIDRRDSPQGEWKKYT